MKHRMLTLIALLALCTGAGASLHAQVRFGAQASWGDNSDFGIGAQYAQRASDPLQLRIGKAGVQRSVADRVDRLLLPPAAALRNRMMPFDPPAKRASTEPAAFPASFHCGNRAAFRTRANRRSGRSSPAAGRTRRHARCRASAAGTAGR